MSYLDNKILWAYIVEISYTKFSIKSNILEKITVIIVLTYVVTDLKIVFGRYLI